VFELFFIQPNQYFELSDSKLKIFTTAN